MRRILEEYKYSGELKPPRVYPEPEAVDPSKAVSRFLSSSSSALVLGF